MALTNFLDQVDSFLDAADTIKQPVTQEERSLLLEWALEEYLCGDLDLEELLAVRMELTERAAKQKPQPSSGEVSINVDEHYGSVVTSAVGSEEPRVSSNKHNTRSTGSAHCQICKQPLDQSLSMLGQTVCAECERRARKA